MPRPAFSLPAHLARQPLQRAIGRPHQYRRPAIRARASSAGSTAVGISIASLCLLRAFATTPALGKKAGKSNKAFARSDASPPVADAGRMTPTDEIYDLSNMESGILHALERLTHNLAQLRSGGRFNPEHIENMKVALTKGAKERIKIKELAQVVPKGRTVLVVVGEQAHVKPIMATIGASEYSLVPQPPSPHNPTTITVNVPPPTGEAREKALRQAHDFGEKALFAIREARGKHHKKIRAAEVAREVRPDDAKRATKEMDDLVKRQNAEVKRIVDSAKKVIDS
ncbi:ribosome recycling factor-domain-containing protein [Lineolata rhizophorae]|uniref:Ribosome recycling factor-domain-containing protein n=1 Tax=Lineolata rhizophorae TaxID=578093 RepID=A0A6A6P8Y0_9PEZI|nr:ribosome recycling factor-domain-containing protein [Lineolata rhizophorae]